jgi:hypothetical protein
MQTSGHDTTTGRVRVERGIYHQPNGRYAVCFMAAGKPRFRTVGENLDEARAARALLIEASRRGEVSVAPSLRFGPLADRWIARYERLVTGGQRKVRTLEAHRYYVDQYLRPRLERRRVPAITVEDVGWLIASMRAGAARRRQRPTPSRRCTACCASRCAKAGSWMIQWPSSRPVSDRARSVAASGSSVATRFAGCSPHVRHGATTRKSLRCTRGCGSPSCSGWTGRMSTSMRL